MSSLLQSYILTLIKQMYRLVEKVTRVLILKWIQNKNKCKFRG